MDEGCWSIAKDDLEAEAGNEQERKAARMMDGGNTSKRMTDD